MGAADVDPIAHVRLRPAMYVGSTGEVGLLNMLWETVSNSLDEAVAGHCSIITVTIHPDSSISIADDGRGLPTSASEDDQFLVRTFTSLRTTATADGHHPHIHLAMGAGMGPVSALASTLTVETRRDGRGSRHSFAEGKLVTGPIDLGPTEGHGTTITITPDRSIFGEARWRIGAIETRLHEVAALTPSLTTELVVESHRRTASDGLAAIARLSLSAGGTTSHLPVERSADVQGIGRLDLHLWWQSTWPSAALQLKAWCNYRELNDPGPELRGLKLGIADALGIDPTDDDLVERATSGARCVLNMMLLDPRFTGPTGHRLAAENAESSVRAFVSEALTAATETDPALGAFLTDRL